MLPVVRGDRETTKQIVLYSLVLVACHRRAVRGGGSGSLYLAAALVLGGIFLWLAVLLGPAHDAAAARRPSSTTRSSTSRCSSSPPPSTWSADP